MQKKKKNACGYTAQVHQTAVKITRRHKHQQNSRHIKGAKMKEKKMSELDGDRLSPFCTGAINR